MWNLQDLLKNFFTHKDFLPPAASIPGTMFTPLHLLFSALCIFAVIFFGLLLAKKKEKIIRTVFCVLWVLLVGLEITKIVWETVSGLTVNFEWGGILPLYPCSIFLYAMPFAIFGKGDTRRSACGYVCTLGFLGGAINFIYPANILGNYSCISFAGFHTFFYHGVIVFCALTMLRSGYHTFTGITRWKQLILPAIPFLVVSVAANLVNFSPIRSDYMFFKLNSFIFAPIGKVTVDWLTVILVYMLYLVIHALPYVPSFITNHRRRSAQNP